MASGSADPESRLRALERSLRRCGDQLALFLVYDRPSRVDERPGLAKTYFAERCVSDTELDQTITAFRSIGAYVELFDGDHEFLAALADGRLRRLDRPLQVVYNGIGFGVTTGGFEPGRMSLIPAVADSYGLICANSDAYTCALVLHRFHSFVVLRALGVEAPPLWHYRLDGGWMGGRPPLGTKVIVKNTYEAWSVGVTDESVFVVDATCERRVAAIADEIGQAVTVQQFISGREVCVPLVASPDPIVLPPVEQILDKAPRDPDAFMTIHDTVSYVGLSYTAYDAPPPVLDRLHRTALSAFDVLQLRALGRMDFRIDAEGTPWLTDVANTPALTDTGSAFTSMAELGFDHASFLRVVVAASLASRGMLPDLSTTT